VGHEAGAAEVEARVEEAQDILMKGQQDRT